jgi:signal transduction histidine kinase
MTSFPDRPQLRLLDGDGAAGPAGALMRIFEATQALARVGGWEFDVRAARLVWTSEIYRLLGLVPGEFAPSHRTALRWVERASRGRLRRTIVTALRTGRSFSIEVTVVARGGRAVRCRATGAATFQGGRPLRVVGALQDITEQVRSAERLRSARLAAETASRAKSAFLATMSHEIRTPMHTVLGYVGLLRTTRLDAVQTEYVEAVAIAGEALLRLIDDILDFSRVEAGGVQLEAQVFDLAAVVGEVVGMLRPVARAKGLELGFVAGDEWLVRCDQSRVRQVLTNLIGNAIKFTLRGGVTVEVVADRDRIRASVRDTGVGITADKQDAVFTEFVQADASTRRRFGGSGLGLAISRGLVRAMGGEIGVESQEGVGSTFWFTLPRGQHTEGYAASCAEAPTVPTRFGEGRRVLLAEDNPLNQRLAMRVLEHMGFVVDCVADGAEAVARLGTARYDLVLMDCLMPAMDGFDATRAIRRLEAEGRRRVPIVALTANAFEEDRQACLTAGMDDFVSKPFTRSSLQAALQRWL